MAKTTIKPGAQKAVEIWRDFKKDGLSFQDILECCAVIMVNVAEKCECADVHVQCQVESIIARIRRAQK